MTNHTQHEQRQFAMEIRFLPVSDNDVRVTRSYPVPIRRLKRSGCS
ncbi:hypothetical protein [Paenibacillus sp. MBLB4367]